ncbi:hypothetical protein H1R20_g11275, partial [Candolleomyces eurysporus]
MGLTAWIVEGIEIQQQQLRIQEEITHHPNLTTAQEIKVAKMKEKLIKRFENIMNTAEYQFPDVDFNKLVYRPSPWSKGKKSDSDNGVVTQHVPLPSQVNSSTSIPRAYRDAKDTEIILRMGEANDALQAIRAEIGYKSYVYRAQIRPYKGKNR